MNYGVMVLIRCKHLGGFAIWREKEKIRWWDYARVEYILWVSEDDPPIKWEDRELKYLKEGEDGRETRVKVQGWTIWTRVSRHFYCGFFLIGVARNKCQTRIIECMRGNPKVMRLTSKIDFSKYYCKNALKMFSSDHDVINLLLPPQEVHLMFSWVVLERTVCDVCWIFIVFMNLIPFSISLSFGNSQVTEKQIWRKWRLGTPGMLYCSSEDNSVCRCIVWVMQPLARSFQFRPRFLTFSIICLKKYSL